MPEGRKLLPLEQWLYNQSSNGEYFPNGSTSYFERYIGIKNNLEDTVYKWIGAATSANDQGVYTDHSIDHFNAVIRYAGKLLNFPNEVTLEYKSPIDPYEVYILLVSILLHDAGNINGRRGHEKHPLKILKQMGDIACPDHFEAKPIADIATVHGGEILSSDGTETKDTIGESTLKEKDEFHGIHFRPQLLAAIVRFADEICEDRSRSACFLLKEGGLPKWSEIYHAYAHSISSVNVDNISKCINIKYEFVKDDVVRMFGYGCKEKVEEKYLSDEIFSRLEKMFCELRYCKRFMYELIKVNRIRATATIYDSDMNVLLEDTFELKEEGYPSSICSLSASYPIWVGSTLKNRLDAQLDRGKNE